MTPAPTGLGLRRAEDLGASWEALLTGLEERSGAPPRGLDALLADLDGAGHSTRRAYGALGLAVRRARTWPPDDRRTPRWWPQGISGPHDALPAPHASRDLLVTTWYSRKLAPAPGRPPVSHGSRVSVVDLATGRHRHVLLVEPREGDGGPSFRPLQVHAGGIVWWGLWLHVAATRRGFATCHLDDLVRVPESWRARTFGHDWVLPMRVAHRAETAADTEPLRYSFLSLDRTGLDPALVVGEYGRGRQTRRLTRWPMDAATRLPDVAADGHCAPLGVLDGVPGMQGALRRGGHWLVSTSHGPGTPGSLWVRRDDDGAWRRRRWRTPVGPEDLTEHAGRIWTVTEHPRRRWIVAMRPPRV